MERFSRRQIITLGAMGVAALGSEGVFSLARAATMRKDKQRVLYPYDPDAPGLTPITGGYRVTCPSYDPDFDRTYCALIRLETPVGGGTTTEVPLLWGDFLDPLDGSTIDQVNLPPEKTYRWITRAVFDVNVYDSPQAGFNKTGPPDFEMAKAVHEVCPFKAIIPMPPTPTLEEQDRQRKLVRVSAKNDWKPDWTTGVPPEPVNVPARAGELIEARLMRKEIEYRNGNFHYRRWEKDRDSDSERNHNWHIVKWKKGKPHAIFNGKPFEDTTVERKKTYAYVVQVVYDYGNDVPDKFRYRSATSEALMVDMQNITNPQTTPPRPRRPHRTT